MGCDSSTVANSAKNPSMGMGGMSGKMGDMKKDMMGGMPNMDMKMKMMSMSMEERKKMMANMGEEQKKKMMAKMKENMKKMMPHREQKEHWSKALMPNPMVHKYIVEYFEMPARSSFIHGTIAAAKHWVEKKSGGKKTIELQRKITTSAMWPERKGQTAHGFMPIVQEVYKCPMSGKEMTSCEMDETVDLCRRICKNACMVPMPQDCEAMGCSSVDDCNKMIDMWAAKIYSCFDGDVTALMDKERGVMSGTTPEQKAEFSAKVFICGADGDVNDPNGKLAGYLNTLKDCFGSNILKTGYTTPVTRPLLTDAMLISWLRRHIYNPLLMKHMWHVVENGGHADWVKKFWDTHSECITMAGGYNDTTECLPIQIL